MPKRTPVQVRFRADAGGVLRVDPFAAEEEQTVQWLTDGSRISIWFPEEGVFESKELDAEPGKDQIEKVVKKGAKPGVYRYVIYRHDTHEFVECNSHPIMIIPEP